MRERAKDPERHARRMEAKQKIMQERIANAQKEQGVLLVLTGPGKGKSSSGFGMILRCIGHGMPCAVVQFIKGSMPSGERDVLKERFSDICAFHVMGEGFTWDTQDLNRDITAAQAAWEQAKLMMNDPSYSMVLMDELNIVLRYDYLELEEVLRTLSNKRKELHVIVTGRNAKEQLIEAADLVTEMTMIKHPFRSGFKAQAGIEF